MLQQLAGALNDTKVSLVVVLSMSKQEHVMQATKDALSKDLWVRCIEFQPKCTKEHWQAAVQHRSISNGVDPSTELFKKHGCLSRALGWTVILAIGVTQSWSASSKLT